MLLLNLQSRFAQPMRQRVFIHLLQMPMTMKDVNVIIPSDAGGKILAALIFFGFRLILPVVLLIAGIVIWWKRRKA